MNGSIPLLDRLAHDLRGPLSPLLTAAHLLKAGQLEPEQQHDLIELMERQARRMALMIDEIGDWARASQGRLLGSSESWEASLLLDHAATGLLRDRIAAFVSDETAATSVRCDPSRLTQLLRTLLEHAIACDGADPAEVTMQVHGDELEISIVYGDTNADADTAARLLQEPLAQPHDEGLGLKLLIAEAIATAHDGSLSAEHVPPGRMRLRCLLPVAAST